MHKGLQMILAAVVLACIASFKSLKNE